MVRTGQTVEARFRAQHDGETETAWVVGIVRAVHPGGRADIVYVGGEIEVRVPAHFIRAYNGPAVPELESAGASPGASGASTEGPLSTSSETNAVSKDEHMLMKDSRALFQAAAAAALSSPPAGDAARPPPGDVSQVASPQGCTLFDEIEAVVGRMRHAKLDAEEVVHGWVVRFKIRQGGVTGDIKITDPIGGPPIASMVELRRRLNVPKVAAKQGVRKGAPGAMAGASSTQASSASWRAPKCMPSPTPAPEPEPEPEVYPKPGMSAEGAAAAAPVKEDPEPATTVELGGAKAVCEEAAGVEPGARSEVVASAIIQAVTRMKREGIAREEVLYGWTLGYKLRPVQDPGKVRMRTRRGHAPVWYSPRPQPAASRLPSTLVRTHSVHIRRFAATGKPSVRTARASPPSSSCATISG